ncbi:MAG: methyltransferase domain-containing protein [Gallionella sp.]
MLETLFKNCDFSTKDRDYLNGIFHRLGTRIAMEQLYKLIDEVWIDLKCNQQVFDNRTAAFYSHPVWLLNGLFAEYDKQSRDYRREFAIWVLSQTPTRVADIGGGFGTLARMIGVSDPNIEMEIIEPHPFAESIRRARLTKNVKYLPKLNGEYDILIATDVFEHVPDPLGMVASTAEHLKVGGQFLIANCFFPHILCHLPQTFHFRNSWNSALKAMGLEPQISVAYGTVFKKRGELSLPLARSLEELSAENFIA